MGAVQIAQGHGAIHHKRPVSGAGDRRFHFFVKLVGNFANDFFQNILEGNQPLQPAIFIDHQREMRVTFQKLAHLIVQRGGFGNIIGFHRYRQDIKGVHFGGVDMAIRQHPVHRPQQILCVQDADDVFRVIAVQRQPCMGAVQTQAQNLGHGQTCVDHFDLTAMQHDFFYRPFRQIKCAQNPVAVFLLHHAFGMTQLQRPGNFIADRQNIAVRVGPHTEQIQQATHQ